MKMSNGDYKTLLASMCLAWVRNSGYVEQSGWSEKRAVEAMLELVEHGYAWFPCHEVGTMGFETGRHVQMGAA